MNPQSARDAVLGRVRTALQNTSQVPASTIPRNYHRDRPVDDIVARFHERVAEYQAVVQRVSSEEVTGALDSALERARASNVIAPAGVPTDWRELLVRRLGSEPGIVGDGTDVDTAGLVRTDAVVTTAAVGIATTGTIVLDHGPGQGRRAITLVPDTHVVIVDEEQIVGDVPDAVARLDPRGPLTFISGPSATSDIELNRVEGVHGPRNLHVIITGTPPQDG